MQMNLPERPHRIQQDDPSTATPRPFPLLSLPAELRCRIYDFVLWSSPSLLKVPEFLPSVAPGCVVLSSAVCRPRSPDDHRRLTTRYREPALLYTCQQIRKEALKLYYGKQAFLVMTTAKCYRRSFKLWLRKIGKSGRAALRHTVYRGFMSLGVSFDRPPGFYDRPGSVLNIYVEISIRLAQKKTDPRYRVEAYPAAFYFPEELEKLNVWVEEMRVEVEKQIEAFIAEKDVLEERDYIRLWRTIAELPDMSNELDEFDEFYHENGEPRQGGSDESEDSNGSDGSEPFVDSDAFNGSEKSDESYKPGPFDESDIPDSSEDSESDAAYEDYESGTSSEDPEFQFDDGTAYWSLARYPSTSQRERLSQEHEARRLLLGSQSQAHNWSDEWEPSDMEAFLFGDDGADSYVSSSSDELYDDV